MMILSYSCVLSRADVVPMVHSSELERIRLAREAQAQAPCPTPCVDARLDKEQRLRTPTGNYGCLVCGADDFSWSQYRAWLQAAARADTARREQVAP
ncbi:MAG: hypothetical protein ABI658_21675 [Acidimicrobiales bacterium]